MHTQADPSNIELATSNGVPVERIETLLTFKIDKQRFALSVDAVSEIIDPQRTTRVPNGGALAPALLNVRGTIVPLIDLHFRLGMTFAEELHSSRLLVVDIIIGSEPTTIAILTDEVDNVIEAKTSEIEPIPGLGVRWPTECFRGSIKRNGALIILFDQSFAFLNLEQNQPTQ